MPAPAEVIGRVALDLGRALMMVAIHDLVEIEAGDTFAYDASARATQAEAALAGQPWSEAAARAAGEALQAQFNPISDMRADAGYRRQVLANLMRRLWLESQGLAHTNLEQPSSALALLGGESLA